MTIINRSIFRSLTLLSLLVLTAIGAIAQTGTFNETITAPMGHLSYTVTVSVEGECHIPGGGPTESPIYISNYTNFAYTTDRIVVPLQGSAVAITPPGGSEPYCESSDAEAILTNANSETTVDFTPSGTLGGTVDSICSIIFSGDGAISCICVTCASSLQPFLPSLLAPDWWYRSPLWIAEEPLPSVRIYKGKHNMTFA
jgi:hypothetical protein